MEAQEQTTTSGAPFEIEFDNSTDRDSTVIRLTGQTRSDLLHILTGAFSSQGLSITSAVIRSSRQGVVQDIFKVTTADGDKVRLLLCRPLAQQLSQRRNANAPLLLADQRGPV